MARLRSIGGTPPDLAHGLVCLDDFEIPDLREEGPFDVLLQSFGDDGR